MNRGGFCARAQSAGHTVELPRSKLDPYQNGSKIVCHFNTAV